MRPGVNKSIRSGTVTGTETNKLIDSSARFLSDVWAVKVGDLAIREVDNGTNLEAVVTALDSDTQLTLSGNIFTAINQVYRVLIGDVDLLGTVGSIASRELNDSSASFLASGVRPGMIVVNRTTGRMAWVTVVAATKLTLSRNIFSQIGEGYRVYSGDILFQKEYEELRLRKFLIVGDSTEVTTASAVMVKLKELLCASSTAGYLIAGITVVLEAKVSSGQTLSLSFRINGVEKGTASVTETVYTVKTISVDASYADGSILDMEIWASVTGGTGHLRVTEIYALV